MKVTAKMVHISSNGFIADLRELMEQIAGTEVVEWLRRIFGNVAMRALFVAVLTLAMMVILANIARLADTIAVRRIDPRISMRSSMLALAVGAVLVLIDLWCIGALYVVVGAICGIGYGTFSAIACGIFCIIVSAALFVIAPFNASAEN